MKIDLKWYIVPLLTVLVLAQCHLRSGYSKKRIPMRELSNQVVDSSQTDSLWQIPEPQYLINQR